MILVLCGLPGAGKTWWARRLQAWLPSQHQGSMVRHLEVDAIEAGLDDKHDPLEAWRRARGLALGQAEAMLEERKGRDEDGRLVLLLDDNMYYVSMRRVAYQLAARQGVGYGCVHVATPMEVALQRNAARPPANRVAEATIQRMATKLEAPDPTARTWEANVVVVVDSEEEEATLQRIKAMMEHAWTTPAVVHAPSEEEEAAKEEDRRRTQESELHATELALRKIIGTAMQQLAKISDSTVPLSGLAKTLGAAFSQAKAGIMDDVREGALPPVGPRLPPPAQAEATRVLTERLFAVVRESGGLEEEEGLATLEEETLASVFK